MRKQTIIELSQTEIETLILKDMRDNNKLYDICQNKKVTDSIILKYGFVESTWTIEQLRKIK